MNLEFFLGANTPEGFCSFLEDWLDYDTLARFYIIKGTPGNGKSGFMRQIIKELAGFTEGMELIFCSADENSLDGVYFPKLNVGFVDGTSPHSIEPKYPLAVECYLPLTQFIDEDEIFIERRHVINLKDGLANDYKQLSRLLRAAKILRDERRDIVLDEEAIGKIIKRANGVAKREIKPVGEGNGAEHKRFLSALNPNGVVTLWETVRAAAERVYELNSKFGLANIFLEQIVRAASEAGLERYVCYSRNAPKGEIEHLILPQLRLAFVSGEYPGEAYRRIRLDSALSKETLQKRRARLRFLKRIEDSITKDACDVLAEAREKHSRLEDVYNPYVDFQNVRALARAYAANIKALA